MRIWGTVCAALIFCGSAVASEQTPEALLASLYQVHQPWKDQSIDFENRQQLNVWFTAELTDLILHDEQCKRERQELCNLESDPMFCAQDFGETFEQLAFSRISIQPLLVEASFINIGRMKVVYVFKQTRKGWRIDDIRCPEGPSLRAILTSPL